MQIAYPQAARLWRPMLYATQFFAWAGVCFAPIIRRPWDCPATPGTISTMSYRWKLLLCVLALIAAPGCPSMWPNVFRPGPIGYQRDNATMYDPYPSIHAGPEVVGGRPREFQQPLTEPRHSQIDQDAYWGPR